MTYDTVCAGMDFDTAASIVEGLLARYPERPGEDIYNAFRMVFAGTETDKRWNAYSLLKDAHP